MSSYTDTAIVIGIECIRHQLAEAVDSGRPLRQVSVTWLNPGLRGQIADHAELIEKAYEAAGIEHAYPWDIEYIPPILEKFPVSSDPKVSEIAAYIRELRDTIEDD